jgi:fused signal recognition particle receptor
LDACANAGGNGPSDMQPFLPWNMSEMQRQTMAQPIPMTGLVLSKLDSSAKGGAVIAIEAELDVPVKLAGVGEGIDDIAPFDPSAFLRALFEV